MYRNELAFKNHKNGMKVAQMLLEEDNVVMLSYEEELLIINWEWSESGQANRNDVIFMPKWEFEQHYVSKDENEDEDENW